MFLGTLFFADYLFGFRALYIRDLTRYYYPTKKIVREVILQGEMPYWNRYYSAGQPMAANPEYEVFYPPMWFVLLPDYDLGYRLHIIVHVYIALLGMYAFLRSLGLGARASSFGAIGFGLSAMSLSLINLLPIYFCAVWIPLIFLFARRTLLQFRWSDFAATAFFLGMQMLTAEPTTLVQTWGLLGVYGLYRAWYSTQRIRVAIRNTFLIAAMGTTALLVGGLQLIPATDHARDSVRALPFDYKLVATWSMHPSRPLELIFPGLFGYIDRQGGLYWASGLYEGTGSPFYFNIYIGLLAIALTLAAIFVRPRGGRIVLAISAASFLVALGKYTPLQKFLYDNRLGASLRYYEKFSLSALVILIVFSAYLAQRCLDGDERLIRWTKRIVIGSIAVAAVFFAFSFLPRYDSAFRKMWGMPKNATTSKMIRVSRIDWGIAIGRGLVALMILDMVRRRKFTTAPALTTGFLIAVDLNAVALSTLPRMPQNYFTPPRVMADFDPKMSDYRVFHEADWYGTSEVARKYFSTGDAVYWMVRNGIFPMTPTSWGLATVLERDYDKTALLPTVDIVDAMWAVRDKGQKRWAEMFMVMSNGWYRGSYRTLDEATKLAAGKIKQAEPIKFTRETSAPRYYFATELVRIRDRHDFAKYLVAGRWTPTTAYIHAAPFRPASGKVLSVKERANDATITVEASDRAFLVMSVTPHKYWTAEIDGHRAELQRANIGYQGIIVPKGRHTIVMRYRNPIVAALAPVSLVSSIVLLGMSLMPRRREERTTAMENAA